MTKSTAFLEIDREETKTLKPSERLKNFKEFTLPTSSKKMNQQASRCMDCGIPYCHNGCPVNNIIPEWNNLVYENDWKEALEVLHSTNNFPEFTGRICPAPCESACTLNIDDSPVTIKNIEKTIIDKAYESGWVVPKINKNKTNKKIAVVGSGPAGLSCAQQLARAGHFVHLFEKNDRIGGLLRYGIPNFKMEKFYINRRVNQMEKEGVVFHCNVNIGIDMTFDELNKEFDAIVLTGGSEKPRDLDIEGRKLSGIHFAMEFLQQQNKRCEGDNDVGGLDILATSKNVVVIGGGDTGSDCIGTSNRQLAKSVTQLEIMDKPPVKENKILTWPNWPLKLRTSSSHEEGVERNWSVSTKKFEGENGKVTGVILEKVKWSLDSNGKYVMKPIKAPLIKLKAELVLLAMGFVHPTHTGLINQIDITLDNKGNVRANEDDYKTSINKVFVAGDMRRGQSLVVWAIREGRQAAHSVDKFLMGSSNLPI
ncbi:MAG: glutamate synthase [Rickettsiales bacterium]|nr:glutamate synthase [Rickettsiales bacterium]OUW70939.1 MAG: glutamate synthase [Rickettsiales bacterium TMED211]